MLLHHTLEWVKPLFGLVLGLAGAAGAQIVTDTGVTLSGPDYAIPAASGQRAGANLFHGFHTFHLAAGESALFSGPADIRHVISRVTGGEASRIDGLLRSTLPAADFYFFNPAGVSFGPNARLDVPGAFHAASAAYLRLADGSRFDGGETAVWSSAPPAAFGFLDAPAALTHTRSSLAVTAGRTLSLSGGGLVSRDGHLAAPDGRIHLAGVAAGAEVPLDAVALEKADFHGALTLSDSTTGTANLRRRAANVDVSGASGGRVVIRGGRILLDNGYVFADTVGDGNGQGVSLRAGDSLELRNAARITAESVGPFHPITGNAGDIELTAATVTLGDGAQIVTTSHASSGGDAGNITLSADDEIRLSGVTAFAVGGQAQPSALLSDTRGGGRGGDISLTAAAIHVSDGAAIRARSQGFGEAGHVQVAADTVKLENGGQIDLSSGRVEAVSGSGNGGSLTLNARDRLHVSGIDAGGRASGVFSNTFTAGRGGTLHIEAGEIRVAADGALQAGTRGSGAAGAIHIEARRQVTVTDPDTRYAGNISSVSFGSGAAGPIHITTPVLLLDHGGQIENSVTGSGAGSTIALAVERLTLDRQAEINAKTYGPQAGGNIDIQARHLTLQTGSSISAESVGSGDAGHVALKLAGRLVMADAAIETRTERADGGDIIISAGSYLDLQRSAITTSVQAANGDGGNVTLTPVFLLLGNSRVIAKAVSGDGGNIQITSTGLYRFSAEPLERAINASSQRGIDGQVEIRAPDIDVSEGLVVLPTAFIDRTTLQHTACREQDGHCHFVIVPYRGAPAAPEGWQGAMP